MSDSLAGRIKRLVSGSINAIVDAAEDSAPEVVMNEAIREVEKAAEDVRHELGKVLANKHHATRRLTEATSRHEELAEKIEFAVREGRDDLAEAAIARQFDLEAQLPVLEGALRDFTDQQAELEGYIAALGGRRREMEDDLAHFVASRAVAPASVSGGAPAGVAANQSAGRVEKAASAFDRVLKNATGIAGSGAADTDTARKLAELDQIARSNRVKERLAAVKAASGE